MSGDRVLIPLPGIGALALSREAFEAALAEGCRAIAAPSIATTADGEPLLDAAGLAAQLGLPQTWIEDRTRRDELPCIRAGRWIRYNRRAVEQALSVNGKGARA